MEANETDYLEQEDFDAKFGKNSFNTVKSLGNIGKVGPMLAAANAYYVVMKRGYRTPLAESYEEALPKIKKRLAFKNRDKSYENYVADLKKKYDIKVFTELVPEIGKEAVAELEAKKKENPEQQH